MPQKIVLKVSMVDDKARAEAMKAAVGIGHGVLKSVTIEGAERDELVVVGSEVDAVRLTRKLRKRLGFGFSFTLKWLFRRRAGTVKLLSVAAVDEKKEKKEKDEPPSPPLCYCREPVYQLYEMHDVGQNTCRIL